MVRVPDFMNQLFRMRSRGLLSGLSVLLAEFPLVMAIIARVPYTEIDWTAYMEQVQLFLSGVRNYKELVGCTGPLVYPGGHVLLYTILYYLTNGGNNILLAQGIFAVVYCTCVFTVGLILRTVRAPLYLYGLLILSKRLHSIFILRLFNDSFNSLFAALAILFACNKRFFWASIMLSLACSVKMSSLLYFPSYFVILLQAVGPKKTWLHAFLIVLIQVAVSLPFISYFSNYWLQAFDFGRMFDYTWTVNWRFVSKELFESNIFSTGLLLIHISFVLIFAFTRWNRITKAGPIAMTKSMLTLKPLQPVTAMTPQFILTALAASNLLGIVCSRSLHYQFYAWFAWYTPYLMYQAGFNAIMVIGLSMLQEHAWNVFPSTVSSSILAVSIPALTLAKLYQSTDNRIRS
ncbi:dolichol-P-Man dependent alpha(1-3) mannosyltransferase Alg3 [Schizosaccharomyces japonicus yFS275]|uniref:Dol-P-Man:Man(5)GlcNAc(2)-PP-Dol alpha-1,3-mannosyltransferase n=1 Tax=Schizosaccharomyces japonicus (strain yFS275 / FY16936) TaxID=402676 RepID=B6K873_SCHJY|nr:dolichol-P-Man dependent alpha(1-3) mannosyltransferase Alg3 [Schizosaccharomyces japonicus yFS275]EEB09727.1 dolichol-P-Man dependent alpha(1-3) mannosyltransferase Alg3 [Schizosaccharomyces japonicus yFS275]